MTKYKGFFLVIVIMIVILVVKSINSNDVAGKPDNSPQQNAADSNSGTANYSAPASTKVTVTMIKTCGCCRLYSQYLSKKGFQVEDIFVDNIDTVKVEYKIPEDQRSCHTTIVGNYIVEGHIPVAAINKMLAEKPTIRGITMAGMPSGSPGMPGDKDPFDIYKLTDSGKGDLFMSL
ncbi:hypothetical protein COT78_00540 [Candidatus Berkelbacteria bacterium CG10_big_fil_rev_8_21_14_0_10_43_13]|uniref:CopG family transcriptional regulator n=1 Tax=Candidatus Berkelbacteria bacterium CG10_big_fil_rev_8_21_14_0_10_43_13 TaxID=1974514 RepID=A0A2H0W9B8_9BACT|nr:MAG: hypothetical protein COT78_00540 [Candidatus Berkelbacteria bacterium CG10_big_fil_rev_8_21_14_0_10_43_13]